MEIMAVVSVALNGLIVIGGLLLAPQIMRTSKIEQKVDKLDEKIDGMPCMKHAERIARIEGKLNGSSGKS